MSVLWVAIRTIEKRKRAKADGLKMCVRRPSRVHLRRPTPHTFALDAAGRILVVANQMSLPVREAGGVRVVPANLAVFRVRADGGLEFARRYDVETDARRSLFWTGILSLP